MLVLYYYISRIIFVTHITVIMINVISIPLLIVNMPIYIWMPMITLLVSPILGGTYCIFNRIENHYRIKAGKQPKLDTFRG